MSYGAKKHTKKKKKKQQQQHINETENIIYLKLVLQNVLEIMTRSSKVCSTAASHGISYILESQIFVGARWVRDIPGFFQNVRNSMQRVCQACLTTS